MKRFILFRFEYISLFLLISYLFLMSACSVDRRAESDKKTTESSLEYVSPDNNIAEAQISIEAQTLDGEITSPPADTTVSVGQTLDFKAIVFDANGNSPLEYRWDFSGVAPASAQLNAGIIRFDQPGIYSVRFTVTDSLGVSDSSPSVRVITVVGKSQGEGVFQMKAQMGDVVFSKNGLNSSPLSLDVGFGSGAYHRPGEDKDIFYTVTDRGPNIKCKDTEKIFGIANFCPPDGDRVFPFPSYTPTIYKVRIINAGGNLGYEILEAIPIKDSFGNNISGLTNNLTSNTTEIAIGNDAMPLPFDNRGLDTEAIVRLQDGTFWLSDEYGPSLVHVASNGTIISRIVPVTVELDLVDVGYPVVGLLPYILKDRKVNRGIEGLAISPDESFLYFSMQSPLANPGEIDFSLSRHTRIFKLVLNNGNVSSVAGEYVYKLDVPEMFVDAQGNGDAAKEQKDVKVSELLAIGMDELIVLERIKQVTKLYRVNLHIGENIHHRPVSSIPVINQEDESPKTLEQLFDLDSHQAGSVSKVLVFNTLTDMPGNISAPKMIEGMAMLDNERMLLITDNDFGIEGETTTAVVLNITRKLSAVANQSKKSSLSLLARYETGLFDQSAAEIVAYHKSSGRIFVLNASENKIDVVSGLGNSTPLVNPLVDSNLFAGLSINVEESYPLSGGINSIAIYGNLLAVAVQNENPQANGVVVFYSLNTLTGAASYINYVQVGALPDSVVFSPNGAMLLVACEGEPNNDYSIDPEGSVASINIIDGRPANNARIIGFTDFNNGALRHGELPANIRIYGGAFGAERSTIAQDLEPEYIAVSKDSRTAFVSLQENNALAVIDLISSRVNRIVYFGEKQYSKKTNALDVSDKDKDVLNTGRLLSNGKAKINIKAWENVVGLYQPDTIASYEVNGETFVVSVNEGAAREFMTGEIDSKNVDQASCELAGRNWDVTASACFKGDTPTMCAAKGFLNKANEECFSYTEEFRVEDLSSADSYSDFIEPVPPMISLVADNFSADISGKINDNELGRLKFSIVNAVNEATGAVDILRSYGGRSFSIWNTAGNLVYDSGSDFSKITAGRLGQYFNASNDKAPDHKKNDRSSAKGVEPAALTIGQVGSRIYAFVGLERVGGVMMYDITSPYGVQFLEYTINRDFTKNPTDAIEGAEAGDVGPEGMKFVSDIDSPTGIPLLIVGNEVSGTVSVYEVR